MFESEGAPVAGGMGSMGDMTANDTWKPYFATDDIEATVKRAEAGGATTQAPAMPVADLGVQAVLADPTGAVFGLWQPGTFSGFSVINEPGAPSWFELHTRDHTRAVAFYQDLFGYHVDRIADTDEFRYFTFRRPGSDEDLGGVMDSRQWLAEGGDHWSIYWHVDDTKTAVDRVKSLGGSVKQGPDDTPYGVLAVVADPAGAEFKLRAGS
jgi:predicted enzyme related to lactoylglutathione lyase